jgi:hypothetical protein
LKIVVYQRRKRSLEVRPFKKWPDRCNPLPRERERERTRVERERGREGEERRKSATSWDARKRARGGNLAGRAGEARG